MYKNPSLKGVLKSNGRFSKIGLIIFSLIFAGIGSYYLFFSHASSLFGDINNDNKVDIFDLSLLLSSYAPGTHRTACVNNTSYTCDINGDGFVDIFDLSILLSHYGQSVTTTIPSHTETWAYDDCGNGGIGASASLVRQWVSYAETNCGPGGDAKALSDCHASGTVYCKVMQYLDTDILYYSAGNASPQWASWSAQASENWYLHVPGSTTTRLTTTSYGGGYFDNQNTAAVQSFYQNYVSSNYPNEDGLFMDDQAPGIGVQFYSASNGTSSNEISTDSALQAAHANMSAAMTKSGGTAYPQVDNTIPNCGNPFETNQGLSMITGNVEGLLAEGCPMTNGSLIAFYPGILDDMAWVNKNTSGYTVLLSYGAAGAGYLAQSRRMQEATVLLAYEPGRVVSWAELEQGNNALSVWPEEGIYPTGPVQSMGSPSGSGCLAGTGSYCLSGGHNDLQVASGVFRREFNTCYNQGTLFGSCAVIVNTTGSAITVQSPWLTHAYNHQITLNGGDVQAGGTINLGGASFTAGSTTVAAHDAILLAP